LAPLDADQVLQWSAQTSLALPAGLGTLRMAATESGRPDAALDPALDPGKLPTTLTVRFRAGGETLQPAGHTFHHKLKKLLQAADILPWWRERLPLVYAGKQLVAVGDLWIGAEFATAPGEPGLSLVWEHRPAIVAYGRSTAR
jgi:tRNA(Ile)-lysidine synthase